MIKTKNQLFLKIIFNCSDVFILQSFVYKYYDKRYSSPQNENQSTNPQVVPNLKC